MSARVYRKTAAGQIEMTARRLALDRRARFLLILCNGRLDVDAMTRNLDGPIDSVLDDLCAQGLLELVPPPGRKPLPAAADVPAPAPAPAPAPPPVAVPDPSDETSRLQAIVRRGWLELGPLFGPGADDRMAPLRQARSMAAMQKALGELRDTLAIYRGRKAAAELVRRIESG